MQHRQAQKHVHAEESQRVELGNKRTTSTRSATSSYLRLLLLFTVFFCLSLWGAQHFKQRLRSALSGAAAYDSAALPESCTAKLAKLGLHYGGQSDPRTSLTPAQATRRDLYARMALDVQQHGLQLGGVITQGLSQSDLFEVKEVGGQLEVVPLLHHLSGAAAAAAGGRAEQSGKEYADEEQLEYDDYDEDDDLDIDDVADDDEKDFIDKDDDDDDDDDVKDEKDVGDDNDDDDDADGSHSKPSPAPKQANQLVDHWANGTSKVAVRAVVMPLVDPRASMTIWNVVMRHLMASVPAGEVWMQDLAIYHATIFHMSSHQMPVPAAAKEIQAEQKAVRRVARRTCPMTAVLDRVVVTHTGVVVACWQLASGGGEPVELRKELRRALPNAPPPKGQMVREPTILHTTLARVLAPMTSKQREQPVLGNSTASALAAAMTAELCGLATRFPLLWYVEERDLLALALQGEYTHKEVKLRCRKPRSPRTGRLAFLRRRWLLR